MKYIVLAVMAFLSFGSCLRLDDNLFNPTKIDQYRLDGYTGEVDFRLDSSYNIADSLIHFFTLFSQYSGENVATKIYAIYIGDINTIDTDTVMMYCHGNRDHMDFYWPRAKLLANVNGKNNYGVLMIDYRGYGLSEGKSSEQALYADVDCGLFWLKSRGLTGDRLIMYGYSLGSAPATKLSANSYTLIPHKLSLEAPFASSEVMVQDATGLALPGQVVTDLKINNGEEIKKVKQPFLWIHGTNDDFLNISTHGEVVFSHYAGSYKEAIRVQGAGHTTIQTVSGFIVYADSIGNFIRR